MIKCIKMTLNEFVELTRAENPTKVGQIFVDKTASIWNAYELLGWKEGYTTDEAVISDPYEIIITETL